MKILLALFAANHPNFNGSGSPKNYPFARELAQALQEAGHEVIQVGGDGEEQLVPDFRRGLSHPEVCDLILNSDTFISVDSYIQHAAWSVGKRGIVLFSISNPDVFGHSLHLNLLKDRSYLRPNQYDLYYATDHKPEAFVSPTEVVEALKING